MGSRKGMLLSAASRKTERSIREGDGKKKGREKEERERGGGERESESGKACAREEQDRRERESKRRDVDRIVVVVRTTENFGIPHHVVSSSLPNGTASR